MQYVQHPPIYFCNIHIKLLQRALETSKTIETYICNIGGERPEPVNSGRRVGAGDERLHASTTTASANDTGLDSEATVGNGGRGAPWSPG